MIKAMIRFAVIFVFSDLLLAAADCLSSDCLDVAQIEELEEAELLSIRTELLQVKVDHYKSNDNTAVQRATVAELALAEAEAAGSERMFYGKVQTGSPSWCGYINKIVQYLVPPCWFGAPDVVANGPGSLPDWCRYVPDKSQVAACHPVLTQTAPVRNATAAELALAEAEAAGSERMFYGKVQTGSPSWCGYINKIVQYLVPPCWFGAPDVVANGPGSMPDWCRYVPDKSQVAACHPVLTETAPAHQGKISANAAVVEHEDEKVK